MSLLPALSPWLWMLLGLVPIGILGLYFLKLRRQPLTVPSTYLWAKTVEDLHVNSLLQRLRTTPLLFLQLLAVALAILALLRPGYRDAASVQSKRVFLLDNSASMAARDTGGSQTRFDRAKELIESEISQMSDQDTAMLMTFNSRSDVLQSFTSDRRKLRGALAVATVSTRTTNIVTSLRAIEGLASVPETSTNASDEDDTRKRDSATEVYLLSDGGFSAPVSEEITNLKIRSLPVASDSTRNLAIVAFSATRNVDVAGKVDVYATVANLGSTTASSKVTLQVDAELTDADQVSLAPGEEAGLSFKIPDGEFLRLQLSLDDDDDLLIDNVAYATLAPARIVSVLLVTPGNQPLEFALSTRQAEKICVLEVVAPSYLDSEGYTSRSTAGLDQLVIFDRCTPKTMPNTNTFFIGSLPPERWAAGETKSGVLLVDIDRTHPIMRHLDLFSILIAEGKALKPPVGSSDLLVGESGPLLSLAPRVGLEDLVLGFDILSSSPGGGSSFNTDWQVQRSWPVFILNGVRYLTGAFALNDGLSYQPGSIVSLEVGGLEKALSIRSPDGNLQAIKPDAMGRLIYSVGDATGIYEITEDNRAIDLFAVNLFDRQESSLSATPATDWLTSESQNSERFMQSRREYWRVLLIGMLVALSLEWWFYGRRLNAY